MGPWTLVIGRVLGFACVAGPTEATPPDVSTIDRVEEIGFDLESALETPHGRMISIEYRSTFEGGLHISVDSKEGSDPYLIVEHLDGEPIAEDDDSGGGKSAYLQIAVRPDARMRIKVARGIGSSIASLPLKLAAAPDDEETQQFAARVEGITEKIRQDRERGDLDSARATVRSEIERALGAKDLATSDDWADAVLALANEAEACELVPEELSARRALLVHSERCLSHDDELVQIIRARCASLMSDLGQLADAIRLQETVVEVATRVLPDTHEDRLAAQSNLAIMTYQLGDMTRARVLFEQVLAVQTRTREPDDESLQFARGNLAVLLREMGDFTSARALEEEILGAFSRTLSDEDPRLQNARQNLGLTLHELRDDESAKELLEKVFEVQERVLPEGHPSRLAARANLALVLHSLGEYERALELEERNLQEYRSTQGDDSPDVNLAKQNLATTLDSLARSEDARTLFEQVLESRKRTLPAEHPDIRSALQNLTLNRILASDCDAARQRAIDLCASERRSIDCYLLTMSPRELAQLDRQLGNSLALGIGARQCVSFAAKDPQLDRSLFELLASLRSLDVVSAATFRAAESNPNLVSLRHEIAAVTTNAVSAAVNGSNTAEFQRVLSERDRLQREFLSRVETDPVLASKLISPSASELAARLSPSDLLITYFHVGIRLPHTVSTHGDRISTRFVAFLLSPDDRVELVDLGESSLIEASAQAWRSAVEDAAVDATNRERVRAAAIDLRRRILDPLGNRVRDAHRWILCLDGILHAVAMDSFPIDDDKECVKLIGDLHPTIHLACIRDLLRAPRHASRKPSFVGVGAVAFDLVSDQQPASPLESRDSRLPSTGSAADPLRGSPWETGFLPLADTELEVSEAQRMFESKFGKECDAHLLLAKEATRENIENLVDSASYLHVATHGWFALDSIRSSADPAPIDEKIGFSSRMSAAEHAAGSSPMVLCGLALAGANSSPDAQGRRKGLITAEEIANWNLVNCQLTILSACETNVGISRAGQGIYSLQKAVHMAGARFAITSLWRVPNHVTRELMQEFYRQHWVENRSLPDALWAAKQSIRNRISASGKHAYCERDWAGWVLSGNVD